MTVKKAKAKMPHMKPKISHAGGGASKVAHGPKVKAHPAKGGAAHMKAKKPSGMTSSVKGNSHIPVKGKGGGKTKDSKQENPFGAGEVIKFGYK
jgi:hypothetical protein